jgi:hypothetical protein
VSESDIEALPLLHRTAGTAEWESGARRGLDVVRGWFGAFDAGVADKTRRRHPHFGPRADFAVVAGTARRDDWRGAARPHRTFLVRHASAECLRPRVRLCHGAAHRTSEPR